MSFAKARVFAHSKQVVRTVRWWARSLPRVGVVLVLGLFDTLCSSSSSSKMSKFLTFDGTTYYFEQLSTRVSRVPIYFSRNHLEVCVPIVTLFVGRR